MAKEKTRFVCNNCGGTSPKMMGKCSHCGEWNTLQEEVVRGSVPSSVKNNRYQGFAGLSSKVENLSEIVGVDYDRISSGIGEFDRVLGGGFVSGGVILIGGDPGIGKSTLLLQAISNLSKNSSVLYVSGEESSHQIAMRAKP